MRSALEQTVMEWTQEWKRIGFEEGLRQGIHEGMATFLVHQLEFHFGPLQPADRQRLEAADSERLQVWCDRLLEAKSVAEVLVG